jgi:hypothetical protein
MELLPSIESRAYRKNLTSFGLIFLGFEEYPIRLINLSLTGLLAELRQDASVTDLKDIFKAIRVSPLVDVYLPDMRMAGEAEVVRADAKENSIEIAIEFRHLSYDTDNLLYNRRAYRKNMTASGQIIIDEFEYTFNTENVSVDGLMIRIPGQLEIGQGSVTKFQFKHLEVWGEAQVIWVDYDDKSTLIGLKYIHLEREYLKGVPHTIRESQSISTN